MYFTKKFIKNASPKKDTNDLLIIAYPRNMKSPEKLVKIKIKIFIPSLIKHRPFL